MCDIDDLSNFTKFCGVFLYSSDFFLIFFLNIFILELTSTYSSSKINEKCDGHI